MLFLEKKEKLSVCAKICVHDKKRTADKRSDFFILMLGMSD